MGNWRERTQRSLVEGWPWLALTFLSYAFRYPALLNANDTNSDVAVVGLQAKHLLRGEWSPFLWGSGYQTSWDSTVAAAFFLVFGRSPLVLMLSALSLHVVATLLVFDLLRRHVTERSAFLATLLLVFTPSSVHSYALYPPRQAGLTLALAGLWGLGRAFDARRPFVFLAGGTALAGLATGADPYGLLFVPLAGLLALFAIASRGRAFALRSLGVALAGFGAGLVPGFLLRRSPGAKNGPLGLTLDVVPHNWKLLTEECLPWATSTKVYYAHDTMDYSPWTPGVVVQGFLTFAAYLLAALVLFGIPAFFVLRRRVPFPARAISIVGALGAPLVVSAFLVSVMVMDHFSMRYLVALTLLAPLAVVASAHALGPRRFALALAPCLLAQAIGGWVGFGTYVDGVTPKRARGEADDRALISFLRTEHLRYATADYWASYRLTLLFDEEVVFVPKNLREDRYAPYRRAFDAAPRFAYLFDPGRSRERLADAEQDLRQAYPRVERRDVGRLSVFVVTR